MINVTHWLGALAGVRGTVHKRNPVRDDIHAAAAHILTLITLIARRRRQRFGRHVYCDHLDAWSAAADLSSQRHMSAENCLSVEARKPRRCMMNCGQAARQCTKPNLFHEGGESFTRLI